MIKVIQETALMLNTGNSIFKDPGEERLMGSVTLQFLSFVWGLLKRFPSLSGFKRLF